MCTTNYAVKIIKIRTSSEAQNALHEGNIHLQLAHPSIPKVFDFQVFDTFAVISMELVRGRSLEDLFHNDYKFENRFILNVGRRLLDVLNYLRLRFISHNDIHAGNIMICENGNVSLLDFAYATRDENKPGFSRNDMINAGAVLFRMLHGFEYHDIYNAVPHEGVSLKPWRHGYVVAKNIPGDLLSLLEYFMFDGHE